MRKGWYIIDGVQDGDRTLAQQIKGLDAIDFVGKTCLELGSAEGLMSKWMIERGAKSVDGIEIIADHVKEAWRQCWGLPCSFKVLDLNDVRQLFPPYDIVMALAILQKLKNPSVVVQHYARFAKELLVVRLPPKHEPWIIIDERSGNVPHNITDALWRVGWVPIHASTGTFDEWLCVYKKAA